MNLIPEQVHKLTELVIERQQIYLRRKEGQPKPWTDDKILQTYRFPNMFREQDVVTRWIADNWRQHGWFAMCVARFNNWPETLAEIGCPVPWDPERFVHVLKDRKRRGEKVFTGAYVIAAKGGGSKAVSVAATLSTIWERREELQPLVGDTLERFYNRLLDIDGIGTFMAAQIIADCKYIEPLRKAPDWQTWAAPGPGSCRGLNRVCGRRLDASWHESTWLGLINELREIVAYSTRDFEGFPTPHAQDAQGFCCEFDKYERTRLGEGRPRSFYEGV